MAQRSVQIVFVNQTSENLALISTSLQHGSWSGSPPQTIAPKSNTTWGSESSGFATGTTGNAIYALQSNPSQLVSMNWDNPFVGTSSYSASGPTTGYSVTTDPGNSGNNATVTYTLTTA